jgi:hypothetical protein
MHGNHAHNNGRKSQSQSRLSFATKLVTGKSLKYMQTYLDMQDKYQYICIVIQIYELGATILSLAGFELNAHCDSAETSGKSNISTINMIILYACMSI